MPFPRDETCPTDCSRSGQNADSTCSAFPLESLLPRSVLPSMAICCGPATSPWSSDLAMAIWPNARSIAPAPSMCRVSVKAAWQGDARSRRKPRRFNSRRDKLRPNRCAANMPLRPLSIDNNISPIIASSRCRRPFLPRGSGICRNTERTETMPATSIVRRRCIDSVKRLNCKWFSESVKWPCPSCRCLGAGAQKELPAEILARDEFE